MSWTYRVARKYYEDIKSEEYGIIEVYFNEEGLVRYWSQYFQHPCGDSLGGLSWDLEKMRIAFDLPVLDYDAIKSGFDISLFEYIGDENVKI